jgi:hypothetical protein
MTRASNFTDAQKAHICVSKANAEILSVNAWEGFEEGKILSDHNGFVVEIRVNSALTY